MEQGTGGEGGPTEGHEGTCRAGSAARSFRHGLKGPKQDQTFFEAVFGHQVFDLHLKFGLQVYFGYIVKHQSFVIIFKYRKKLCYPADCLSFKRHNTF